MLVSLCALAGTCRERRDQRGTDRLQRKPSTVGGEAAPHLVHVDVVEVVLVVDGLEHALQLPGGSAVDHQDEGDPDGVGWHVLHGVFVPLNVLAGFAWGKPETTEVRVRLSLHGAAGSGSDFFSLFLSGGLFPGYIHVGPWDLIQLSQAGPGPSRVGDPGAYHLLSTPKQPEKDGWRPGDTVRRDMRQVSRARGGSLEPQGKLRFLWVRNPNTGAGFLWLESIVLSSPNSTRCVSLRPSNCAENR